MDSLELSYRDRLINNSSDLSQEVQTLPNYRKQDLMEKRTRSKTIEKSNKPTIQKSESRLIVQTQDNKRPIRQSLRLTEDQYEQIMDLYDMSRTYYQERKLYNKTSVVSFKQWFKQIPTLSPNSIWMLLWEGLMAVLILFLFFTIPIYVTFGEEFFNELGSLNTFYLSVAIFFLLLIDMILEFFTAYYQHGALVTKKSKIAKHYIHETFIFDLIAIVTFGFLTFFTGNKYRFFYFLIYLKAYSLSKIDEIINEGTLLYRRVRNLYGIAKIIIFFFYSVDMFACGFYLVGSWSLRTNQNSWLQLKSHENITISKLPVTQQYLLSCFFSMGTLSTTMGYGALNNYECSFCGLGILFGVFILSIIINYMHKFMEDYNQKKFQVRTKRIIINKFLESKNVPSEIKTRVKQQLNEHWEQEGSRNLLAEQDIIRNELHGQLQEALIYSSYGAFLQQLPLFKDNFSDQFLRALSFQITEITLSAGETLFKDKKKHRDNSLYFIASGSVIIRPNIENSKQIYSKKLRKDEFFGEYSFFTGKERLATAEAHSFANLYKITRADFIKTIADFPEDFEQYHFMRDKLLYSEDYRVVKSSCWFCNKSDHYFARCPLVHYIPNTLQLVKEKNLNSEGQNRFKIDRIQKDKWPTLKKLELTQKTGKKNNAKRPKRPVLKRLKTQMILEKPELELEQFDKEEQTKSMKVQVDEKSKEIDEKIEQEEELQLRRSSKINSRWKKEFKDRDIDLPANFKRYFNRDNQQIMSIYSGGDGGVK